MRERTVGFRHLMGLFTFADGTAGIIERVQNFTGEIFIKSLAGAAAGSVDDPVHRQSLAAADRDFYRNLVKSLK